MSPRYLKTVFPCKTCGEPAPVERLRDAERAICDACSKVRRATQRIGLYDDLARHEIDSVNGKADREIPLARGGLRAATKRLEAAVACLDALPVVKKRDSMHYARCALSRARWAASLLKNLEPHLEAAIEEARTGFEIEVLDGGREYLEIERTAPALELIRGGRQ